MRILVVFLLGLTLAAQQSTAPAGGNEGDANQKKAREVLNKMIEALGGPAYLNLKDSQTEGRAGRYYHGSSSGSGIYFSFWQWPDKERAELTKDRDVVVIHNGEQGFETTFRGTAPEKPETLRTYLLRRNHSLATVLRQWLSEPGTALFYEGLTITENHQCDRVSLINGKNDAVTILISTDRHLPVKKMFTVRDPVSKEKDEEAEVYDNWKNVQGINTPFDVVTSHNGEMVSARFLDSIKYNNDLAASLFEPSPIKFNRLKK
ncbi:MAG TPA: hypothetical protein VKZ53_14330 [Candidatus Angelobacter sp.]|nr:hypothetical protein [Candidatus Angelobacter sp.]